MAFNKLSDFFGLNGDDEDTYRDDISEGIDSETGNKNNVVSINRSKSSSSKIKVFEPTNYSDAKTISKNLLEDKAILVNFSNINDDQMLRLTDFLTGTVFAINGDIKRIDKKVFLFTPANFEIDDATNNLSE